MKLHKAGIIFSNLCWRCKIDQGDITHMFLMCPRLNNYWRRVMEKINDSLGQEVNLTPALCLLNCLEGNDNIGRLQAQWLKVAITTAKRVILRHWLGQNIPTYSEWLTALSETASYERLIYKINGKLKVYLEVWSPFFNQVG